VFNLSVICFNAIGGVCAQRGRPGDFKNLTALSRRVVHKPDFINEQDARWPHRRDARVTRRDVSARIKPFRYALIVDIDRLCRRRWGDT
jgi:hypothetical protein